MLLEKTILSHHDISGGSRQHRTKAFQRRPVKRVHKAGERFAGGLFQERLRRQAERGDSRQPECKEADEGGEEGDAEGEEGRDGEPVEHGGR